MLPIVPIKKVEHLSFLLAGAAIFGCGQVGPKDLYNDASQPLTFTRSMVLSDGKALLTTTFRNVIDRPVNVRLREFDLNLYEPDEQLPMAFTLPPGSSKIITLHYPIAVSSAMTVAEKALVLPQDGHKPQEPCLNYRFDVKYPNGSGSFNKNEMESPNPGFIVSPIGKGKTSTLSVTNDSMPRDLDFRLLSISGNGLKAPKMPLDLTVRAGGSAVVVGLILSTPVGQTPPPVVLKYEYRLKPNKTWQTATMGDLY